MKTTLKIELFNDDKYQASRMWDNIFAAAGLSEKDWIRAIEFKWQRPWVARIIGIDPHYRYQREFLQPSKDYSEANSVGSRGVFLYYWLDDGAVYEVKEQYTWRKWRRYFCQVRDGQIVRIEEEDVVEWLKNR